MPWQTVNGTTAANAGTSGLKEFAAGDTIGATELLRDMRDPQDALVYQTAPGVMYGGACTVAGLTVTIPSGTLVFCRSVWYANGAMTQVVTDDATTYVWLCSDGETRITANTTPPATYDARSACILCRCVASSGTAVVDLSVQERAAYSAGRYVGGGTGAFSAVPDVIPDSGYGVVADERQMHIMDDLTVYGELIVHGKLRVE